MTEQVTDERRRKVAARLREGWSPFEATCAVLGRSETRGRWEGVLADLIDRPACRIEGVDRWTPAASIEEFADVRFDCGHSVTVSPEDMPDVRYCPVCGAEVVPDA